MSLKSEYENDKTIEVILSSKNLGFANGNNLGFEYIHKNFDADFVVMLNNDTYLLDDNFNKLVKETFPIPSFILSIVDILFSEYNFKIVLSLSL